MQNHNRRLVLRNIGDGITVLVLLAAIEKLRLSTDEGFALAEALRDVADGIEHRVLMQ
jgi:hypothetical protein